MSVNTITNQREITPKINKAVMVLVYDIVFLCFMTHRRMCFTTVLSLLHIALTVFNLQRGHESTLQMVAGKQQSRSRVMLLIYDQWCLTTV